MIDDMERPDISQLPPAVRAYIEALEAQLAARPSAESGKRTPSTPDEPETTLNVLSLSSHGRGKRTPRHLYSRQNRAGMGVFDLEANEADFPTHLTIADETADVLLLSNYGRAFRLPVRSWPQTAGRATGQPIISQLPFRDNERVAGLLPADAGSYLIMVSQRGWVQRIAGGYVGPSLLNGMSFHNVKEGGLITAVCWTNGDAQLFIASRQGKALRFNERQISVRGGLGMRVDPNDEVVAVTAVSDDSHVFLLGHDGKGTLRHMSTFMANKAPGAGGKAAMKTEQLVAATTVTAGDDLFIISQLGKIIRFAAADVPPKEGAVQGVNCMSLRNDTVTAVAVGAGLTS